MNRRTVIVAVGLVLSAGCTQDSNSSSNTTENVSQSGTRTPRTVQKSAINSTQSTTARRQTNSHSTTDIENPETKTQDLEQTPPTTASRTQPSLGTEGPELPDIQVDYEGPPGGKSYTLKLTIRRKSDGGSDNTVFERTRKIEPSQTIEFDNAIRSAGTYQIQANLIGGSSISKTIRTPDGGIPDYVSYRIEIIGGEMEVQTMEI